MARKTCPPLAVLMQRIHYRRPVNTVRRRIRGQGNRIVYRGSILTSVVFDVVGNGNTIEIAPGCLLNGVRFRVRGDDHEISIAEGCKFHNGANVWFEDSRGVLSIGSGCNFEQVDFAVTESDSRIDVGSGCLFSRDVDVRTGDSHSITDARTGERVNSARSVSFGDRVWVAAHCIVLKGASIPSDSVVGAGSVVTGKFLEPGTIIAGNPARAIRSGIRWSCARSPESGERDRSGGMVRSDDPAFNDHHL